MFCNINEGCLRKGSLRGYPFVITKWKISKNILAYITDGNQSIE